MCQAVTGRNDDRELLHVWGFDARLTTLLYKKRNIFGKCEEFSKESYYLKRNNGG
jgi:hypothetical protein